MHFIHNTEQIPPPLSQSIN